ncbi:variable surface protein [Plasmodium gonderi]|uniref:Variable surface protein n=1 Tax=Plasmodium gonderi TaxID=77519 RepID=A0A1Y1JU63_PLAGO|nr:variable surface protein [Plasmodium gonderi]GAW83943.1 variable surface protein [Plasmodium gonderi]
MTKDIESIMDIEKSTAKSNIIPECNEIVNEIHETFRSDINYICKKVDSYTRHISQHHPNPSWTSKSCCIYLHYWLYIHYNSDDYIDDVKQLYNKLINVFYNTNNLGCKNHENIKITNEEMLNLKYVYDMHVKLNKISKEPEVSGNKCECAKECAEIYMKQKYKCMYNRFLYFCNALEEFRKKYYDKISSHSCDTDTPKHCLPNEKLIL